MPYTVRTNEVRRVLQPVLGTGFVTHTPLCTQVAELLSAHDMARTPVDELCRQLKELIFAGLYEQLGYHMTLRLENGVVRRILLQDVDFMVDEALGVLLDATPHLSMAELRSLAMERGSLSAMRVLLARHGDQLHEMEREMLRRIIRENHPMTGYAPGQGSNA